MNEWTPWLMKGFPEVGDYIQVKCTNELTQEDRQFEGMIASVEDGFARFVGETENTTSWVAYTWRKLIPSDIAFVKLVRELENVH